MSGQTREGGPSEAQRRLLADYGATEGEIAALAGMTPQEVAMAVNEKIGEISKLYSTGDIIENERGDRGVVTSKWITADNKKVKMNVLWLAAPKGGTNSHTDTVNYFFRSGLRPTGERDESYVRKDMITRLVMSRLRFVRRQLGSRKIPGKFSEGQRTKFLEGVLAQLDWETREPTKDEIDEAILQYYRR